MVQLSLQHGRELAPEHTRYMAGLLTTGYAIGQLVGPILSAISTALTHRLEPALYVAVVALVIAGALVIKTRLAPVKRWWWDWRLRDKPRLALIMTERTIGYE